MAVVCDDPRLIKLNSTITEVKSELQECKVQLLSLKALQTEFYSQVSTLLRESDKMDKENNKVVVSVTLTDSETQTCYYDQELPAPIRRRWNSDLSLDLDGKSQGKRYNKLERNDLTKFCLSTEAMMAPPIIRIQGSQQKKSAASKSKFTNRLDVGGHNMGSKRQANLLLSDLGLTSQAPEFSQSEFNLSSDDHWLRDGSQKQSGGRVRFLSHEGGPHQAGINNMDDEEDDCLDLDGGMMPHHNQIFHSHSGSWATLTHSERDLSEMDSCLSLNHQDLAGAIEAKPYSSSTPYKGLRSKFKQSVSFHDLLPSKAVHCCSMPNIPKQNVENARRTLPLSGNMENSTSSKRHSLSNMDQRSQSFTTTRRSSLTGNIENGPYVPSAIGSLFLGGRVKALHSGQVIVTGVVWYRGKLPGISEDVVGIELDQVGLGGDGTWQGHRYFRCSPGRGLFVPFRKIIMAWPTQ